MTTQSLPAALTIRALGDESEITITTPHTDLMADTIDPMGVDVTRYLNGTRAVNFAHDHGRLPVAKTVSLAQTPQGIRARFRWLDSNPEAHVVRDVFAEGVLGASVELVPVERETNRRGGVHFAKSILTGWALTANPANPECVRMVKSLRRIGADDELVVFEEHDLRDAVREVLGAQLRAVARRQARAAKPVVFLVADDDPPAVDDRVVVDAADVKAAMGIALAALVGREVRSALNRLTGRVD